MLGTLKDHALPIHCPKCGASLFKTVSWLTQNDEVVCPCGTTMHLDTRRVVQAVAALEGALCRIIRHAPGENKIPV